MHHPGIEKYNVAHESEKQRLEIQIRELKEKLKTPKEKAKALDLSEMDSPRELERQKRVATTLLMQTLDYLQPRTKTPDKWARELYDTIDRSKFQTKQSQNARAALSAFIKLWLANNGG